MATQTPKIIRKKVILIAQLTRAMGETVSCYNLCPHTSQGYVGPLTQQGLMTFWGDTVDRLPVAIWAGLQRAGALKIRVSEDPEQVYRVKLDDVTPGSLAVVSYKGSGKYANWENKLIYWCDLPVQDPVQELEDVVQPEEQELVGWWPVVVFNCAQLGVEEEEMSAVRALVCVYQGLTWEKPIAWTIKLVIREFKGRYTLYDCFGCT